MSRPNIYTTNISLEWSEPHDRLHGDMSQPSYILTGGSTKLFIPFHVPPNINFRQFGSPHGDFKVHDVRLTFGRFVSQQGRLEIEAGLPNLTLLQNTLDALEQRILTTLFHEDDNSR